jgi:hypothetical protein
VTPLYATADGGAIVTSTAPGSNQLGTLYTVDRNGNVSAQTADNGAVLSWTGLSYAASAAGLSEFMSPRIDVADVSFVPVKGGNPSATDVALQRCAPLPQASNNQVEQAASDLYNFLLFTSCQFCISNIFPPLDTSQAEFTTFLGQGHEFCDGTKSQEPGGTIGVKGTVADYFAKYAGPPDLVAAATAKMSLKAFGPFGIFKSSERSKLKVFFAPQNIDPDPTFVKATVFHEGLHGFTGLDDWGLCGHLRVPSANADCGTHSVDITCWIARRVFSMQDLPQGPGKCPAGVAF